MTLEISYQTLQLPAPFAHAIALLVNTKTGEFSYGQEYFGRENMTTEEIEAEGFTSSDDWAFTGDLPQVWLLEIKKLEANSSFTQHDPSETDADWLHLTKDGQPLGTPSNPDHWTYLLQELTQAICEIAGKEQPLSWMFYAGKDRYKLEVSFADRTVKINNHPKPWPLLHHLMATTYSADLDNTANKGQSLALDMGDGTRYGLDKKAKALLKLLKTG
jgi:hypothetical protein